MRATTPDPNIALSQLIGEAGCSYEGLAAAVQRVARENHDTDCTTKATVAHWVAGTRPRARTAGYLAEALSRKLGRLLTLADLGLASEQEILHQDRMPIDPVAALASLGRADVDRRTFITSTAYSIGHCCCPCNTSKRTQPAADMPPYPPAG